MRHILPLSSGWEMRPVSETAWLPATVPGTVYGDLLANGKMPDPFYRDNEDIAFALMAVQTQTTNVLDSFPTKAAETEKPEQTGPVEIRRA